MEPLLTAVPVISVSAIFCVWNAYRHALARRQRVLCERVAYMLWVLGTTHPSRQVRLQS
jgi:hypothetical protein